MIDSPQARESAYRAAVNAWFELPEDTAPEILRTALAEIEHRELDVGRFNANMICREVVGAFWSRTGVCGYCGTKVEDINAHLGQRIVSKTLSPNPRSEGEKPHR